MIQNLRSFALSVAAVCSFAAVAGQAQSVMTHHVRDVVRNGRAQSTGRLPMNQELQLDLVLPLKDPEGLKAFLANVNDPTSPSYRHFLTVNEFTALFGPTQDQYDAVLRFARTYGLEVVGGSRDAMDVQVKGSAGAIETAFHVNLRTYRHPTESRDFYGVDSEPTVDLPFNLWHVSGLDNYSIPHPLLVNRNDYAAAHGIDAEKVVSHATTGSGPSASFLGSDMRAAYYGSGSLTGSGQNLGLWEYLGTDLADLQTYYTNVGQTYPGSIITLLSTDGTSTSCVYSRSRCDDTEQTLDMTQALGMAPGLASLVMYIGSSDTAIIGAMTSHSPLPTTIGCSWGWTPADPTTLDPYFQRMAAQGQNFFAASGDYSTWTASGNSAAWPADDANVVSVGGTDLNTASAAGPWASETAWADSGGGISPDGIAIPSWQQLSGVINSSNRGSTTLRNGPDVSANANFTFYTCANQTTCNANLYGGTSFAAPMWAGYIALVNQQLAGQGQSTLGFLNPTIYAQNVNAGTYAADFHDITSGTSGSYSAVTGYDLVTGWGSPNAGLLAALTGSSQSAGFTLSASKSSLSAVAGSSPTLTITANITGTLSSGIALSASGQPTGSTVSFNPSTLATSGSPSSTMTITLPSSTATGTYTITVKGTSGSSTVTTTVTLTVTGTFTITGPGTLTLGRSSSTSGTITVTATAGSISSVTLSASGAGSGTTLSLSPTSVAPGTGSAKSTITVKTGRHAALGTYTITIGGSGGGSTGSTTFSLVVN